MDVRKLIGRRQPLFSRDMQRHSSIISEAIAGSRVTNTVHRTDPDTGKKYTALKVTMSR